MCHFQTAASVLKHRLPHSAKPHPRILPQRGISLTLLLRGDINMNKELVRTIRFTLFSISAGAIELVLFTLLDGFTDWPYWPCYLIALVASVVWNFTLNRNFTFQSANNVPIAMLKVAAFYAVFTPVSTILGNYLAETAKWPGILVTILNMLCNFVLEYLYDRFFVFGKSIDTNSRAKKKDGKNN
jgi:putative flippase GtrA